MEKTHYCYKITNLNPTDQRKYYIGVRSSKTSPEEDTNYKSSSKYLKEALEEIGHNNFKKEILSTWDTRKLANKEEARLHELYDVAVNPEFYNKSKAISSSFCTEGMVTVINKKTGDREFVSIEESKDKLKYKKIHFDKVNVTDKITGKKHRVSKEEYKNNPNLEHTVKGKVTVIDTETGIRKHVTQYEFDNNPNLVGQMLGRVNCIDTRTGKGCSVTTEEFVKYEYYQHTTKNTMRVYDTRDKLFKRVSLEDYEKYDYYISQNSRLVEVYDANDVLQYSVFNKFRDFCVENKLPINAFFTSKQNNGQPLYENSGSNAERLKKQGYWKFKGWYAVNKTLI
jgi:hypothetical protein